MCNTVCDVNIDYDLICIISYGLYNNHEYESDVCNISSNLTITYIRCQSLCIVHITYVFLCEFTRCV